MDTELEIIRLQKEGNALRGAITSALQIPSAAHVNNSPITKFSRASPVDEQDFSYNKDGTINFHHMDIFAGPLDQEDKERAEAARKMAQETERGGFWAWLTGSTDDQRKPTKWYRCQEVPGNGIPKSESLSNDSQSQGTKNSIFKRAKPLPDPPLSSTPPEKFQLTPMSKIIASAYNDIAMLRRIQTKKTFEACKKGIPPPPAWKDVDFDKVEANLRRFEKYYQIYLKHGGKFGDEANETHMVTIPVGQNKMRAGQWTGDSVPEKEPLDFPALRAPPTSHGLRRALNI